MNTTFTKNFEKMTKPRKNDFQNFSKKKSLKKRDLHFKKIRKMKNQIFTLDI